MTRDDLEKFVTEHCVVCWRDLIEWEKARGGSGKLCDTAISLTKGRTVVTVYSDYHDDELHMSAGFRLPEPLPPDEDVVRGEIIGDWQRCDGGFLLGLHRLLESDGEPLN